MSESYTSHKLHLETSPGAIRQCSWRSAGEWTPGNAWPTTVGMDSRGDLDPDGRGSGGEDDCGYKPRVGTLVSGTCHQDVTSDGCPHKKVAYGKEILSKMTLFQ